VDAAFWAGVAYAIDCFGAFSSAGLPNSVFLHQTLTSKGKNKPSIQPHLTVTLQKERRKQREQTETKCACF